MNSPKKEAGFTILEILIAISILAFGLLAVATMQATSIKGNSQAIGITEGITLAQDKIEEFIGLDYNHALITTTQTLVILMVMAPPRTLPPMTALMTIWAISVWMTPWMGAETS
jgi:prepilin-type N-terminal cleavage/methylation domain-containing protein